MEYDPLGVLVLPHEVILLLHEKGLLIKKSFTKKEDLEAGRFAIFHGKTRLSKLHDTYDIASSEIERIIGNKNKCRENKRIFQIRELGTACAALSRAKASGKRR